MNKTLIFIKKYWHLGVIYILLVFIGHQCTKEVPKADPIIIREDKVITLNQAIIDEYIAREKTLVQQHKDDSVKAAKREIAHKREIAALKKKASDLLVEVQPALDTLPKIAELVGVLQDINTQQEANIDSLNVEKFQMKKTYELRLDAKAHEFKAATEMNDHLHTVAERYKKENKKLRKQNTWLKIGVAALVVAVIVKE